MMVLGIEADVSGAVKALEGTSKSLKSIERQVVGIVARGGVKAIKSAIRTSGLQRRTGELLKAYRYKVKKSGGEANIFPKALNSSSTIYPKAMTLSYGHTGPTRRNSRWEILPRCFVQSGREWIESGKYDRDIERMVQKQLDKYWR